MMLILWLLPLLLPLRPILDGGRGEGGGTTEVPLDPFEMIELLDRDDEEVEEIGADGDP